MPALLPFFRPRFGVWVGSLGLSLSPLAVPFRGSDRDGVVCALKGLLNNGISFSDGALTAKLDRWNDAVGDRYNRLKETDGSRRVALI